MLFENCIVGLARNAFRLPSPQAYANIRLGRSAWGQEAALEKKKSGTGRVGMLKHCKLQGWVGLIFYPLCWGLGVARHASRQPTWPRRIGLFASFVPVLLFHSLLWLGAVTATGAALLDLLQLGFGKS